MQFKPWLMKLLGTSNLLTVVLWTLTSCGSTNSDSPSETPRVARMGQAFTLSCADDPALNFEQTERWRVTTGKAALTSTTGAPGQGAAIEVDGDGARTITASEVTPYSDVAPSGSVWLKRGEAVATGSLTIQVQTSEQLLDIAVVPLASVSSDGFEQSTFAIPLQIREVLAAEDDPLGVILSLTADGPVTLDGLDLGVSDCQWCVPATQGVEGASRRHQALTPPGTDEVIVEIELPEGRTLADVALSGDDYLLVNDGSRVLADDHVAVTNTGDGTLTVGSKAEVGNLISLGDVWLRGATVNGDVTTSGAIEEQHGTVVNGTRSPGTPLRSHVAAQWTALLPTGTQNVLIPASPEGQALGETLEPGAYGVANVGSRSFLRLSSGSYVFERFYLQPQAELRFENTTGVTIYVKDEFSFRGKNVAANDVNNLLFVYLGTEMSYMNSAFFGTIVAPNGGASFISDELGHRGAAYAKQLEVHQHTDFTFEPFVPTCIPDKVHPAGTRFGCPDTTRWAPLCEAPAAGPVAESCYSESRAVWGFADLHAHPATHLGFGWRPEEGAGLFHGGPGLQLSDSDLIAECNPDLHTATLDTDVVSLDPVKKATREAIIQLTDKGHLHNAGGESMFESWPDARSVNHQQMHVKWIRRAFEGGLRLMFASVADNELLHRLWHNGANFFGNDLSPIAGFELESAQRQLDYIQQLAAANDDWMQIVTSPSQAREAIRANKLALVLSLEMDHLGVDEILQLKDSHDVRSVVPIHLVNNGFGGTAYYDDLFNGNNWYLNGVHFDDPIQDPNVSFFLGAPPVLKEIELGAYVFGEASRRYPCQPGYGHRNPRGLADPAALRELMEAGMLVDVSHMSQAAVSGVLDLARSHDFPVLSSHTGLRKSEPVLHGRDAGAHERDLLEAQAAQIAELGGVVGLGTRSLDRPKHLFRVHGGEILRFGAGDDDDVEEWSWDPLRPDMFPKDTPVEALEVRLRNGSDGKRDCNEFTARVGLRDGSSVPEVLGNDEEYPGHSITTFELSMPAGTTLHDIVSYTMSFDFDEGCGLGENGNDDWHIVQMRVRWRSPDGTLGPLVQAQGSVFNHGNFGEHKGYAFVLNQDNPSETFPVRWYDDCVEQDGRCVLHDDVVLDKLRIVLDTGADDLDPREVEHNAEIHVKLKNSCEDHVKTLSHIDANSTRVVEFDFGRQIQVRDIERVWVETFSTCEFQTGPFVKAGQFGASLGPGVFTPQGLHAVTGVLISEILNDGCINQDNWDMDRVRVQGTWGPEIALPGGSIPSNTVDLVRYSGRPWARTTGQRTAVLLYDAHDQDCNPMALDHPAEFLEVAFVTGKDDAEDQSHPKIEILRRHGLPPVTYDLNPSAALIGDQLFKPGEMTRVIVPMGEGATVGDLDLFRVIGNMGDDEDWDIDEITVNVLSDPIELFSRDYRDALSTMGGRGVALGTDLNGLQDQLAYTSTRVSYPFSVTGPEGEVIHTLGPSVVGSRMFDFATDGIAHYGMLADFVQSIKQRNVEHGADSVQRLFRSAEDVLQMWEKIETRAAMLRGELSEPDGSGGSASSGSGGSSGTVTGGTSTDGTGMPPAGCSAATAIDMGAPGEEVTVPSDGCLRVLDDYPEWWGASRSMLLQTTSIGDGPVPLTWSNECAGSGGSGSLAGAWSSQAIGPTNSGCATVIDLMGAGGDVRVRYYGQ